MNIVYAAAAGTAAAGTAAAGTAAVNPDILRVAVLTGISVVGAVNEFIFSSVTGNIVQVDWSRDGSWDSLCVMVTCKESGILE